MTTPEAESTKEALTVDAGTAGSKLAGPPARPIEPPIPTKTKHQNISVSPAVLDASRKDGEGLLGDLRTSLGGLTQAEAEERARTTGPNEVAQERRQGWPVRVLKIIRNPLVILLTTLSAVSFLTGDARAGSVMAIMVALSVGLRFWQEARADAAAQKLKAMIHVTATVVRDGAAREIPLRDLVPGDIVKLAAGDMIPGDVRLLASKDLFVSQGSLTGESLPVEKFHDPETKEESSPAELKNTCFMGTSVESGTATAAVVTTGAHTYLGSMARSITGERAQTSFDQGLNRFTWLMMQFMAVMVPLVFLINGFTKHDWKGAFFFAMAVAVGLTPEMLPMIVSVCLSNGALAMSRKRVIVKRLNAIQNFGGMDVLCTDKTGTLTEDRVVLMRHCNVAGCETDDVLLDGYLISYFQTGLKNLLDRAILDTPDFHAKAIVEKYKKLDEIPFDFTRRMMSVLVQDAEGKAILLTKGAPEEVFLRCSHFELDGKLSAMDPELEVGLKQEYDDLSKERVIRILRGKGHVVGFMGDGINDAPALRAADVGISVDTATDIAKESADLILLEKNLMVLEGGVIEGRKVFANIVKYIRMGASSNFGNMFSVLGASAFLPFLPMAPIQVLTNNLLYDFSQVPIPADAVDDEQVTRPRPWNIGEIKRFILFIGPISSIFDYTTFFVMLYIFNCWDPSRASLFQTGWFVESLMTQTLIIHVIRTNKIPFLQSRASWALTATTLSIMALGMWLPYSPLASALGFTHLPWMYWPILMLTLFGYMGLTQIIKVWLLRKQWI